MGKVLSAHRDIRGARYDEFLIWGASLFPVGLLVIRPEMELSPRGWLVLEDLSQHQIAGRRSSAWPGTQLLEDRAEIVLFGLNPDSRRVLSGASRGLFDWQMPELGPERHVR